METRLRMVLPDWTGVSLVVLGALLFFASYFLLPIMVGGCFDSPCGGTYPTTWQLSLNSLSGWQYAVKHVDGTLVTWSIVLVLYYLPLLAAATVVACGVGFLVWPHLELATWRQRAWVTWSIALVLMLLMILVVAGLVGGGPQIGFLGLMVGYGLVWAGNRVSSSLPHP